jgi:RHS repeat-associated protein
MKTKFILLFAVGLFLLQNATAQKHPWEEFGYKPRLKTLSNGKYMEFHDWDTIVHIGSVIFDRHNGKILGKVENDSIGGEERMKPYVVSRWISPDPLSEEYSSWSPYNYTMNNPIKFIDPDGRASIIPPTKEEYEQYGVSEQGQERFDAILQNISSLKDNKDFMNAFMKTTGLSESKAIEYLAYDSGPKVELMAGTWANATNYIENGSFNFGAEIINNLGNIPASDVNTLGDQAFGVAMVLTDEISHCGDMETNQTEHSTGESFKNPGKQDWNFSPALHRGADARGFAFGIDVATGPSGEVSYSRFVIKYQPAGLPKPPAPIKKDDRAKIGNQLLKK